MAGPDAQERKVRRSTYDTPETDLSRCLSPSSAHSLLAFQKAAGCHWLLLGPLAVTQPQPTLWGAHQLRMRALVAFVKGVPSSSLRASKKAIKGAASAVKKVRFSAASEGPCQFAPSSLLMHLQPWPQRYAYETCAAGVRRLLPRPQSLSGTHAPERAQCLQHPRKEQSATPTCKPGSLSLQALS